MAASTNRERAAPPEHRWPALIAIVVAVAAYAFVPSQIDVIPRWIVPTVTALMLIPLIVVNPHHFTRETTWSRWLGIGLAVLLAVANQAQVVLTIGHLVQGTSDAPAVLLTALQVWLTDVIAFALIYWELDRGGPFARRMTTVDTVADFRFPQEDDGPVPWRPGYVDYLYFSLSNMMAFSPTDVMPLTSRAKGLMGFQALTGFVLLALVISRAVNILG
ncbi:hypothetical protein BH11ACT3_BH11ACT3_14520 [soil metagenome]